MKKIRKSLLSLLLVCAVLTGTVFLSTVSVFAASPQLNLVKGSSCFNVVWNKVPDAARYRLYFGVNCRWRRYTVLNLNEVTVYPNNTQSVQFLVDHSSLTGRSWLPYGVDGHISTPNLTTTNNYCCQVEAFDKDNNHLAWTNVGYVYLGTATISAWPSRDGVGVSWNPCKGGNNPNQFAYQIAYKYAGQSNYTYQVCSASETSFYSNGNRAATYYFQVRPCIQVNGKIVAYGYWSKTATTKPSTTGAYMTASAAGIKNLPITYGSEQRIIDNYEAGVDVNSIHVFDGSNTLVMFGHSNKTFGNVRYLEKGNYITVKGEGKTLNYQVYYKGICKINDLTLTDINTGTVIKPFHDRTSKDLYLLTCYDSMPGTDYVIKAKRI